MLPLRHCDIATTDQTHWHLIQSLVRCGKRRAFVRMSHVHILKIIVHGHPVQYQTRTVLLLYCCMVAKQLPAVSSPVCDGGCLIALCCDRRAPTGSPVQTFDHAVQCRLAFVCFEKKNSGVYGKLRGVRFCSHSGTTCGCNLRFSSAFVLRHPVCHACRIFIY